MKTPRLTIIFSLCLMALSTGVFASDMALSKVGTLYRATQEADGLVVRSQSIDGETSSVLVPQTTGVSLTSVNIEIDESNQFPYLIWQEGEGESAQVLLAALLDGAWFGPVVLDGAGLESAMNPEMIFRRESSVVEIEIETDDGIETETIEETAAYLHTVWWSKVEGDTGVAMYSAIPILSDGTPDIGAAEVIQLGDLLPYGIGCSGISDTSILAYPKLFIDPASGNVNVFATDYANCLFQVLEFEFDVDWDSVAKRGRHSIILGRSVMIAINPELDLSASAVKVGRNLSVVVYWDEGNAVLYSHLDQDGWTETKSLELTDTLDHEQAVGLIEALTN